MFDKCGSRKKSKVQKASAINFNNMLQQCLNNHSADKRTFNIQDFCDLKNSKPKPCVATIGDLSRLKIPNKDHLDPALNLPVKISYS